jgi:bacteriorhodopsin
MAIVANHEDKKIRSKFCSKAAMFVGYCDFCEKYVYQFMNLHTNSIFESRDVVRLKTLFSHHMGISQGDFTNSKQRGTV